MKNKSFSFLDKEIDIKDLSCGYSSDSISDGVLGYDGKGMFDPKNDKMRQLGNRVSLFSIIIRISEIH